MFSDMSDEVRNLEKTMDFLGDENISRTMNFFIFCNETDSRNNYNGSEELTSSVEPSTLKHNDSETPVANSQFQSTVEKHAIVLRGADSDHL